MNTYLVEWSLDVIANSPLEAARIAKEAMCKPENDHFTVIEYDGDGDIVEINLSEEEVENL